MLRWLRLPEMHIGFVDVFCMLIVYREVDRRSVGPRPHTHKVMFIVLVTLIPFPTRNHERRFVLCTSFCIPTSYSIVSNPCS